MNRARRASGFALAAEAAFAIIYIGEIVLDGDSFKGALFFALTATDASVQARLTRGRAFILIYT